MQTFRTQSFDAATERLLRPQEIAEPIRIINIINSEFE